MKILLLLAAASFLIGCSSVPKETWDYRSRLYNAKKWEPEYLQKDSGGSGVIFRFYGEKYPVKITRDFDFNFWAYPLDSVVVKKTVYGEIRPWPDSSPTDVTYIYYHINKKPISVTIKADSTDKHNYLDPRYQLPDNIPGGILKVDSTDKYTVELSPDNYLLSWRTNHYDSRYGFSYDIIMRDIIVRPGFWSIVNIIFYREPILVY